MKSSISDAEAIELLRLEELRRSLKEDRFSLRHMRRSLYLCLLYAVAIFFAGAAMTGYGVVMGFFAVLTVVFTLMDEYDQFARNRLARIMDLMAVGDEKR